MFNLKTFAAGMLLVGLIMASSQITHAGGDPANLLAHLPEAKITLAAGIAQAAMQDGFPISAKLEMSDDGKVLNLSIYTAGQGKAVTAEDNDLVEVAGDATAASWAPGKDVFADKPHIARASMHLTLMQQSNLALADILARAATHTKGTIYSIIPEINKGKPTFKISAMDLDGKNVESSVDVEGNVVSGY